MRRPVNEGEECSDIDQTSSDYGISDTVYSVKKEKPRTTESRFAKVKRILSGTLSLGRTQERENMHQGKSDAGIGIKCSADFSKIKSARKRDRSQEKSQECNVTNAEIGLKLTKLVEYEIKLQAPRDASPKNGRKRKENHDIVSSNDQERKLIRSNSEERSLHIINKELNNIKDIRRVSSHEDFKKKQATLSEGVKHYTDNKKQDCSPVRKEPLHEINFNERHSIDIKLEPTPESLEPDNMKTKHISISDDIPLHDINSVSPYTRSSPNKVSPNRDPKSQFFSEQKFLSDFESEHEKRRTSERFSRPLTSRGRNKTVAGRKRKTNKDKSYSLEHQYKISMKYMNSEDNNDIQQSQEKQVQDDTKVFEKKSDNSEAIKSEIFYNNNNNNNETKSAISEIISEKVTISDTRRSKSPKIIQESQDSKSGSVPFDFNTLHEQIDSTEPVPISSTYLFTSDNNEDVSTSQTVNCPMLSPRNSLIMTRKVYLDPLIPNQKMLDYKESTKNAPLNPVEARIKQITKQINSIKKKLKRADESSDLADNLKTTERPNDKKSRAFTTELNKLKKELKCLKSDSMQVLYSSVSADVQTPNRSDNDEVNPKRRVEMIRETFMEIQRRLSEKRQHSNRCEEISEMTDEQLIDEKIAVQKALLHLESIHGRPISKEDRDVVRPLYDRYRILKRIVARTTNAKLNNSITELGTILEHETMHFVSTPIQESDKGDDDSPSNTPVGSIDSSDTDTSISENLHALSLDELLEQQRVVREEKKQLRRSLKEYEHEFELKTGRKLQKDDRTSMESTYFMYKQIKGKLKLIEILIEKKRQANN